MKILAIIGSPKGKGNSYSLTRQVERKMKEIDSGIEFEYLFLKDANLEPCRGCYVCLDKGEHLCPIKDSRTEIERKMLEADGAVFATPVYVYNVSWLFKNFLDRFAYCCHRPRFFKPALALATTGGVGLGFTLLLLRFSVGSWGFKSAGSVGGITPKHPEMLPAGRREKQEKKAERSAEAGARKLYASVIAGNKSPGYFGLLQFYFQKKAFSSMKYMNFDYEYWNGKGWLDKRAIYYYDARASIIKRSIVGLIGQVFGIFL